MSCAKTDEPIEWLFGGRLRPVWAIFGPTVSPINMELYGAQIPFREGAVIIFLTLGRYVPEGV